MVCSIRIVVMIRISMLGLVRLVVWWENLLRYLRILVLVDGMKYLNVYFWIIRFCLFKVGIVVIIVNIIVMIGMIVNSVV